jgi:hypothetical protein
MAGRVTEQRVEAGYDSRRRFLGEEGGERPGGKVGVIEDGDDTRDVASGVQTESQDPRVRVRASQERGMELRGPVDVGDELTLTSEKRLVLDTTDARSYEPSLGHPVDLPRPLASSDGG